MLITNKQEFDRSLVAIRKHRHAVIDVETSGLSIWKTDKLCGFGICTEDRQTFYYPFRHVKTELPLLALLDDSEINLPIEWMGDLWQEVNTIDCVIGHNIKFDLAAMHRDGFDLRPEQYLEDTIAGARMYFPGRYDRLSLDNLVKNILGGNNWKKEFQNYLKINKMENHFDWAPPEIVGPYCEGDVKNTFDCRDELIKYIDNTDQRRIWDQECATIREALWEMEKHGLFFDIDYCKDRLPKMKKRLYEIEQDVYQVVGHEFDIASNTQLNLAMNELGIYSKSRTKSGSPQWDSGELLTTEHPLAGMILEWRTIEKQRSVYFEPLLDWPDSYIHPSYKSWGTITGRVSCESPNLQNLAKGLIDLDNNSVLDDEAMAAIKAKLSVNKAGTDNAQGSVATGTLTGFMSYGKNYDDMNEGSAIATRRLYVPPPGYQMYMIDFSQMEMRVFADYVKDEQLSAMLIDPNSDFHDIVAMEVWKVDKKSSMWDFYRTMAKCINFGLLYGIGNKKLAGQMQCTEEEAKGFKTKYFQRFPKAGKFMRDVQLRITQRGYVTNRFGRRYHVPEDRAYVGVNYLIQGTSADIVKNRMVAVARYLRENNRQTKMVCQVHDEIVFYVKDEEEHFVVRELKNIIEESTIQTFLPTEVSKGFPSWAQKKKICTDCMSVAKILDTATGKMVEHECPEKNK